MKVTAIKSITGRFSIFVDGAFAFSLSDAALLDEKIVVGQEFDEGELKRLKQVSDGDKLYDQVLRYAALRPHSEWEMRGYLQRKQVSPALTEDILNKLIKNGIVDDLRFAQAWVENRRLHHPESKRKWQQALRAKRVSDEVILQVLAAGEVDEHTELRRLIAKKRARYPDKLKLMQYLARQGFSYEDIKAVLAEET